MPGLFQHRHVRSRGRRPDHLVAGGREGPELRPEEQGQAHVDRGDVEHPGPVPAPGRGAAGRGGPFGRIRHHARARHAVAGRARRRHRRPIPRWIEEWKPLTMMAKRSRLLVVFIRRRDIVSGDDTGRSVSR